MDTDAISDGGHEEAGGSRARQLYVQHGDDGELEISESDSGAKLLAVGIDVLSLLW